MSVNNDFSDLALPQTKADRSIFVFFKIIFLPVATFVLALLAYLEVINFEMKAHTIVMMAIILIVAVIFTRHSAEYAYSIFRARGDDFRQSLKKFIVSHLLEISGLKKSRAGFNEFLDEYTRNFRNDNLASIGSAVFPMLGILGTFISIAMSMPSFSSGTAGELEKEIAILLNGVGTAFYVSIYGIFLALWWMFFEKIGISKFEKFANEQKELSREFFWQKDELEQLYMSAASSHFEDMKVMFTRVSNEEYFKRLDSVTEAKFSNFMQLEEAQQKIVAQASETLEQNVKILNKAASRQDEFIKIHSDILNAMSSFNDSLKELELKISTQYNRASELNESKMVSLDKSVAKFSENLKLFDLSLKEFSVKLLNEQNAAMKSFRQSIFDGVSEFKSVYEQEIKSSEREKERDVLIAELKKSVKEIDQEASLIIQKIENANLIDENR
ncbi:MotA/TolQ/ExbB proton channel family protein [Campylobacter californiensis]|uniref:MotA/TolQ/ExbB proton channel family protein n=1 Tax=Campylobacter californiensis TaxID=1032243 RepID=UPI001472C0C0|nr:MotA/TolQ/ExbB proton channel family protein [Campylobacter sp. RM12916]MBE3610000.1 MotA/TolQ/ExbB proton channel family protein [Campylobacter sp. RM12916]